MSDVLENLKYRGGKDGLLFFICNVIGSNQISIHDAEVICSHAPGNHFLFASDLIDYCRAFGWIQSSDDVISLSQVITPLIGDKDELNDVLISSTIDQLFDKEIITAEMFNYDAVQCCYAFKNELLPLSLSSVRNILISQGFFIPSRDSQTTRFYIVPKFDPLVAKHCKNRQRKMSLERFKKQLEANEIAGDKAEIFVLEYEKSRLGEPLGSKVKRISDIDVTAGYDIVSYDSDLSESPDRFIEVKALSSAGFYWSKNEYDIAKLKGDTYYLYLVDLRSIDQQGYVPQIIKDPASNIMDSGSWYVEAQSYHIKHI